EKMLGQVVTIPRIDRQPAGRSDNTCVHDAGLRQILFADLRAGAVRTDQHVPDGWTTVLEEGLDLSLPCLLVADELLAKMDHVVQPLQQHFPERGSIDWDVRRPVHDLRFDECDLFHLFGEDLEAGAWFISISDKGTPGCRGQAVLQCPGTVRINVNLITLQPTRIGSPGPFLVNDNANPRLAKPLGQA